MCLRTSVSFYLTLLIIFVGANRGIAAASEAKISNAGKGNKLIVMPGYATSEMLEFFKQAEFQYYQMGDLNKSDSLSELAVQSAEMTYRAETILLALNHFMSMNELGYDRSKAMKYAIRAEGLVFQINEPEMVWTTFMNLSTVYLDAYRFDEALSFSYKALTIAESINAPFMRARSYLKIGTTLQDNNQTIEGFRYFLNALTIAESIKEKDLLLDCYKALSRFYSLSKGYQKAVEFKLRQIELILKSVPVDSLALVWAWVNLEEISIASRNPVHEGKLNELISFSVRHKNSYLKQYTLALYRTYLTQNNRFTSLRELYIEKYPEELEYLHKNQPSIFYRLQAIFYELDGDLEAARSSYQIAESIVKVDPNKVMVSNFYIRYGEFLQRRGLIADAVNNLRLAFDLAQEANYMDYSLKASTLLVELYTQLGDYRNALIYSESCRVISDSLSQLNRKDELMTLEIQNAAQLQEMSLKEEAMVKQKRNNVQYSFIFLMILGLFLILILLGSFKVRASSIHFLGFFSFIFLFEFIILIADNYIHRITHGEPLKVLGIKIVLIAFLLPLHHWIERKVTHYLVHKKLLSFDSLSIRAIAVRVRETAKEIWSRGDS